MSGRFFMRICVFSSLLLVVAFVADAAAEQMELRRKHENDVAHHHAAASVTPGAWNQDKPKRLFARTRYLSPSRHHAPRPKSDPVGSSPVSGSAPVPVRRCAGLMESCSGHVPCCEPCASCHCRLFNTICHCWKLGPCPKKT